MFGLLDCNNFYVSCHRVFRPELRNVPVVVLSNNDGCIISRSNEAKKLGVKMGAPEFQAKSIIQKHGIQVFSSQYVLYGDMSNRVIMMLSDFTPNLEIYSIDEAFLDLSGFPDLKEYGTLITQKIIKGTGIPVSLGIGPTKTLAKIANRFAKKYPFYNNVCVIDTEEKRIKALRETKIGDVWGIGRQHEKKLQKEEIITAYDFIQFPRLWVRKNMTVTGEKTWLELRGESCIALETIPPVNKQICTSRCFGKKQSDKVIISEAIANYAALCAEKLREQKLYALSLMVSIHTDNFRPELPQYFRNYIVEFNTASNSTIDIIRYAREAFEQIYREGYLYKKGGVIITETTPETSLQLNLFDSIKNRDKHKKLMSIMDNFNNGYSKSVVKIGSQGTSKDWVLKQEKLSPCYTTKLSDIIKIKI